jgi:diguanylate cyclase (GGDEF)-like protein
MTNSKNSDNIPKLARLLAFITIISAIVVVALTGLGMHDIYSNQVINMAKEESVLISSLLVKDNLDTLISQGVDGTPQLIIDPLEVEWLNQSFGNFLGSLNIVKVKIFTPDTRVAYSTENQLIGELDLQNKRLMLALSGEVGSHIEAKDQIRDLKNEHVLNVDVVETYVPIKLTTGKIVGAFELYMNVTKFRNEIRYGTFKSLFLLSSVLLIVYLVSHRVVRVSMVRATQAEAELHKQATVDALTGIPNCRSFSEAILREFKRAKRERAPLSVIMCDIDQFKLYNDSYGHAAGDECLKQVAKTMAGTLKKPADFCARYGGEEFIIILPNTNEAGTLYIAEQVRAAVQSLEITHDKSLPLKVVTLSLGVATMDAETNLSNEELVKRADDSLYLAKKNGRNCLVSFKTT